MPPDTHAAPVSELHLQLLKNFGRSETTKGLMAKNDTKKLEILWIVACDTAKLPRSDLEETRKTWREVMLGQSPETKIHVAEEVEPDWVSIGIAYKGRLHAGHTTKTALLIKRLLSVWRRKFQSDEEMFDAVERLYKATAKGEK